MDAIPGEVPGLCAEWGKAGGKPCYSLGSHQAGSKDTSWQSLITRWPQIGHNVLIRGKKTEI